MSAEEVLENCGHFLSSLPLGEVALQDLSQAIKLTEKPILQLMYELGTYSGLAHNDACQRVLPILFQRSAFLLTTENQKQGVLNMQQVSSCVLTLQHLFNLSLSRAHVNESQQIHCYKLLALVGATQQANISTQKWDLKKSMQAAKGLSGYQFEAYCSIISSISTISTTPSNKEAHELLIQLGHAFGILNHITRDIQYKHDRFAQLNQANQAQLKTWALNQAKLIADAEVTPLSLLLPPLMKYIR